MALRNAAKTAAFNLAGPRLGRLDAHEQA